jgi:antitoxin ParD1/3/4
MTRIQVTLPESATQYIESQVASGQYATPSEYLGFLVERARAAEAKEKLDAMLEDGLNSGGPIQFSDDWWRERKATLLATLPVEATE